ncbi:MAG TPA: pyridoxal phosphate-dependent aminotransferase [Blastocatellia bacterium]|nr:pyridoxal phosphate-dependent aminotransferase [Blastocatellia bacterium]
MAKTKPDIRTITRMVPRSGNLVQGQSELRINPDLAHAAGELIADSQNHYSPAEGAGELRRAVAHKLALLNNIHVDPDATPLELLITPGATGGLIAIAQTYLRGSSTLVLEPYYPYHSRVIEELGGRIDVMPLRGDNLELNEDELRKRCRELKSRSEFPLRAIIACTPSNPTGKVFTPSELETIAKICQEFDLLCIADEVYEHYVVGEHPHTPISTLPGMWERTITVNSFSKSWNISGWRLGYAYGDGALVSKLNNANNVFYVCSPTPLQLALARVLMETPSYYDNLKTNFSAKRERAVKILEEVGFKIYNSGSAFYIWARIPEGFGDAMQLNEMLMSRGGVAATPGSAFSDGDDWDNHMRICIAREDNVLDGALEKLRKVMTEAK